MWTHPSIPNQPVFNKKLCSNDYLCMLLFSAFLLIVTDHKRESHLPWHHEVLPQPTSVQQPCRTYTDTHNTACHSFPKLHPDLFFLFCGVCALAQVYRSVLLRQTPREQMSDENMEVDLASGGECKIPPVELLLLIQLFLHHTSNLIGREGQVIFCQPWKCFTHCFVLVCNFYSTCLWVVYIKSHPHSKVFLENDKKR